MIIVTLPGFLSVFGEYRGHPFENGFDLTLRPERLLQPLAWKKPRMIFVNSMSDLFHKEIPKEYIDKVFDTMEKANWHIYQVLTKRSSLLQKFLNERYPKLVKLLSHMWFGVSVENETGPIPRRPPSENRIQVFVFFQSSHLFAPGRST